MLVCYDAQNRSSCWNKSRPAADFFANCNDDFKRSNNEEGNKSTASMLLFGVGCKSACHASRQADHFRT